MARLEKSAAVSLVCLAALWAGSGGATPGFPMEQLEDRLAACLSDASSPDRRITDCTWLLDAHYVADRLAAEVFTGRAEGWAAIGDDKAAREDFHWAQLQYDQAKWIDYRHWEPRYRTLLANFHCGRGALHWRANDMPSAMADFEEALKVDPANRCALSRWEAARRGDPPPARRAIQRTAGVDITGLASQCVDRRDAALLAVFGPDATRNQGIGLDTAMGQSGLAERDPTLLREAWEDLERSEATDPKKKATDAYAACLFQQRILELDPKADLGAQLKEAEARDTLFESLPRAKGAAPAAAILAESLDPAARAAREDRLVADARIRDAAREARAAQRAAMFDTFLQVAAVAGTAYLEHEAAQAQSALNRRALGPQNVMSVPGTYTPAWQTASPPPPPPSQGFVYTEPPRPTTAGQATYANGSGAPEPMGRAIVNNSTQTSQVQWAQSVVEANSYPQPDAMRCLKIVQHGPSRNCGMNGYTLEVANICREPINIHACLRNPQRGNRWDCGSGTKDTGEKVLTYTCVGGGDYLLAGCTVAAMRRGRGNCGGDPNTLRHAMAPGR